ncbi:hypothetical protein NQ314_016937 [Rhamnusium bicolor]|uniref:PiggyBac transposable element-derived protein domain-containing protein n=1 Tax=Rhamnusium bicolor TaxID=1586634 RepID=A0AAV8WVJ7_9CUCU|nr:hypothetical protein NQ314_016937 [Rhamnusium bicolor]
MNTGRTLLESEDGRDTSEIDSERDPSFVPEDDFVDDISLVESSGEPIETSEQEVSDDEVALEQHLTIDKQMCSTKVRHYMKQYMPMEPHEWGFKFFVLAGVSAFACKFEIYTGLEKFENLQDDEPNLVVTSKIVLRLARIILRMKNYDYTMITTTQLFRLCHEYVATFDGEAISSLIWKDNISVTLISSFAGKNPVSRVRRFDRKEKKNIDVDCPYIITEYNRHMGGVDFLVTLMGRYKIRLKSRKWSMRLFYHLVDITLVNAWRVHFENGRAGSVKNQAEFRSEVAYHLCHLGSLNQ